MVIEADDRKAMELAMIENLQREDLNPMEEAAGYQELMDRFGLTQEQVSAKVGNPAGDHQRPAAVGTAGAGAGAFGGGEALRRPRRALAGLEEAEPDLPNLPRRR